MIGAVELAAQLGLPSPTPEQVAVIEAPLAPALVVAGAGSGKTETMAARVVYLVATGQVRPEQVLGLTFTRKAAAVLSQRVRRRLRMLAGSGLVQPGDGVAGDPEIATYHSFGGRLIGDFGPLAGIEPAARVLTPTAAWQLARQVVGRWDGDLDTDLGPDQVTERLLAISGALADHLTGAAGLSRVLEDLLARLRSAPPSPRQRGALHSDLVGHVKRLQDRQWILPLVQAFADAKRDRGVIDFADQMQIAATLVLGHSRIGVALRERYRVVLLDEYQDTGHAQRIILRALFGAGDAGGAGGHPVTAVGDPVQSIYSWRGASAANLPRFVTDFPQSSGAPAVKLSLLTSFRNPPSVLRLANEISATIRTGPDAPVEVGELRPTDDAATGDVRYGLFATVADEDAWLANSIADRWRAAMDAPDAAPPTTAVLLRRRSDMAGVADALRSAGLPVEVVGLGGLLDEPEIADLVATLRILVDPTAGAAAVRLLTGARWRIGAADLEALSRRSRQLVDAAGVRIAPNGSRDAVRAAISEALSGEDIDAWCLIDAISDPGPPDAYSPAGFQRLARFGAQLRRLRGRMSQPLADLVADVERATGLDIEVQLGSPAGRAHLDAFADVVAEVAATGAGPHELLGYLDAAAEREDGLTPGEVQASTGRVQVLTVHAAKGLEWEIVAVPHLTDGVFPTTRGSTWLGDAAQLPPDIRGDRDELPKLSLPADGTQKDIAEALAEHARDFAQLRLSEERRLLYVALTRAERVLLLSGHHWGASTAKPGGPSDFLLECAELCAGWTEADEWAPAPDPTGGNPLTAVPRTANWPVDPLGDRRAEVRAGADLVLAALSELSTTGRIMDPVGPHRYEPADRLEPHRVGHDPHEHDPKLLGAAEPGLGVDPAELGLGGLVSAEPGLDGPESTELGLDGPDPAEPGLDGPDPAELGLDEPDPDDNDPGEPDWVRAISAAAESVETATLLGGSEGSHGAITNDPAVPTSELADPYGWAADVTTLLAERGSWERSAINVELPGTVSVSALVELADDPERLARRLRRPVPLEPAPHLRRGTVFHQWLERFFRGEALLDVRDLPGAGDGAAGDDAEFDALRSTFLGSSWSNRVPVDIEVPFATRIAGLGVRGRIDAVFADPDGGYTVVDWKTGRPPPPSRRAAVEVQLACYRLAQSELTGVPLAKIRAAFHYVATGITVSPVDLLDAAGIADLVNTATGGSSDGELLDIEVAGDTG